MKRKVSALLLAVLISLCAVMSVSALSENSRVTDDASLLSSEEVLSLTEKLDEISERQQLDVVIHTTYGTDGKALIEYADDYYDSNGYGFGNEKDGCILVIDMESRGWWISTTGYGITAFTDGGIEYIGEEIEGDLSNGSYYSAFTTFAELCDDFITAAYNGTPYDYDNLPKEGYNWFFGILISLAVGIGVGLVITLSMKSKLKTVRSQPAAKDYLVDDSLKITQSRDIYLYRNISRVAKPKQNTSSGSSTHTSSSGTTHGGGGGSF